MAYETVALLKDHPKLVEIQDMIRTNREQALEKATELEKMIKRIDTAGKETNDRLWHEAYDYAIANGLIPADKKYSDISIRMQDGALAYSKDNKDHPYSETCTCTPCALTRLITGSLR